jgi:hypothetical protein
MNNELKGTRKEAVEAQFKDDYFPGICLEGLKKAIKEFSQDSRSPGRDLKSRPPESEGVITTQFRH